MHRKRFTAKPYFSSWRYSLCLHTSQGFLLRPNFCAGTQWYNNTAGHGCRGMAPSRCLRLYCFLPCGLHDVATKRVWAGCEAGVKPWAGDWPACLEPLTFFNIFIYFRFGCIGSEWQHLRCSVPASLWLWPRGSERGALQLWHLGLVCSKGCGLLVPGPGIEPPSPALEGGF